MFTQYDKVSNGFDVLTTAFLDQSTLEGPDHAPITLVNSLTSSHPPRTKSIIDFFLGN